MTEQAKTEAVAKPIEKAREIIRGRIALAIVFLIRFVDKDMATKEAAEKYGTTVGKVDDIKKNRNFAYVTEDVRFTQAQIDEAVKYIEQHEDADQAAAVKAELEKLEIATDAQAAAFAAVKKKAGGQSRTDSEGKVHESGGGNRQGKAKKEAKTDADEAEQTPAGEALSADDLLGDI